MHEHAGHPHSGAGRHPHLPKGGDAQRRILIALGLTGGFMLAEVAGGILSGSLALLADAGHMLTDVGALLLAYAGARLGARPADARRGFGYRRFEVLAAFVNGLTLIALTAWIGIEALQRLFDPVEVLSGVMLTVAVGGLIVNVAAFAILRAGAHESIGISGALAHVLGDLLGSVAAITAALVIRFTGWMPIDPLLSILIALLILHSGWLIVKRSGHILLEGTPEELDVDAVLHALRGLAHVADAHHLHVWSLTTGRPLATVHLGIEPGADTSAVLHRARQLLAERFGITHSTIEIEFPGDFKETDP